GTPGMLIWVAELPERHSAFRPEPAWRQKMSARPSPSKSSTAMTAQLRGTVDSAWLVAELPENQSEFWPVDAWRQTMSSRPSPSRSATPATRQWALARVAIG